MPTKGGEEVLAAIRRYCANRLRGKECNGRWCSFCPIQHAYDVIVREENKPKFPGWDTKERKE